MAQTICFNQFNYALMKEGSEKRFCKRNIIYNLDYINKKRWMEKGLKKIQPNYEIER